MSAGGTFVLLYHRVAHLEQDPYGLAVSPERFAHHCDILRRRGNVVPLGGGSGSAPHIAITFDDGYADNAGDARSILTAARLPATFFITVGRIGQCAEVWWDRLEQIVLECETDARTLEVEIAGRPLWIDMRSASARARAHLALFWRLRTMRPVAIEAVLANIESQLGVRSVDRETHRWMSVAELRTLASSDGIDIGAHTITHPFLASLDAEEQSREIEESGRSLERMLDRRVTRFSYPYGGPDAFDHVTAGLVSKAGYSLACTTTGGIARPGCNPLAIPRNVVGDWDAERFEQWLDHWLAQ